MHFEEPIALQDRALMSHGLEKRKRPRRSTDLKARIYHRPSRREGDTQARVLDFNRDGARIETLRSYSPGDWITLDLSPQKRTRLFQSKALRVRGQILHGRYQKNGRLGGFTYGVQFAQSTSAFMRFLVSRALPWVAALLIVAASLFIGLWKTENVKYFWYSPLLNTYSLLVSTYILSRFVLAVFYKPPERNGFEPTVTVAVVCKNEEASIFRTLQGIFQADYPAEKMQVLAVDDGSTDGTLAEMQRVQNSHSGLQIISFGKNRGKRHGMAEAARAATGEILIFVDSDSFIQPDAIHELVAGFADPDIGGVCGHANVENLHANLLTRMQEVRYFVAFRVVKSAESIFNAVTCCSGCLAAYRKSYLLEFLDEWLDQTFLGAKATFGDDRSLTNKMLRNWKVIYNSRAVCTTLVPETWKVFFRQQVRWKKSWIRESLLAMGFMWKRNPLVAFFFYVGVAFPLISPLVVGHALFFPLLKGQMISLQYIYGTSLMAALFGLVYLARFRNRIWIYGIAFSFFYMLVLVWQTYYAILTVRKNHWGTR